MYRVFATILGIGFFYVSCQAQRGPEIGLVPIASFSFGPVSPETNQPVYFTDTSAGNPTSWQWNFDDGATSTVKNPTHTFATAGSYGVTLNVSNGSGSDSVTRSIDINPTSSDVHRAASSSLADIRAAIASATPGDTVMVPTGISSWGSDNLVVTKAISLVGEGIGSTVITSSFSSIFEGTINYAATTTAEDAVFRLSGFSITNTAGPCFSAEAASVAFPTACVVDHCRLDSTNSRTMITFDPIYGVAYSNQFLNEWVFCINGFGLNETTWSNRTFAFGTKYNFYYEDNSFQVTDAFVEGGAGGRYCVRYNTITCSNSAWPLADAHGNMGPGGNLATMGCEMYENKMNLGANWADLFDHRGGMALFFNNNILSSGSAFGGTCREEVNDGLNPPATSPNGQPQYPSTSYYWGNRQNGTKVLAAGGSDTINYGGSVGLVPIENVHFWNEATSFNGTVGVGVGLRSARPASCTKGVGYWATDEHILYIGTATNVWTAYYTPYTYPHPLRTLLSY